MIGALFSIICAVVGFYAGKIAASDSNIDDLLPTKRHNKYPATYDDFKNPRIFGVKMSGDDDYGG